MISEREEYEFKDGGTLVLTNGEDGVNVENKVIQVTDAYILKESEKGNQLKVKKDLFKWIVDRIRHYGFAEAIDLRNEFHTQASSFVTLIFAQIPMFKVTYNPRRIEFNNDYILQNEKI